MSPFEGPVISFYGTPDGSGARGGGHGFHDRYEERDF